MGVVEAGLQGAEGLEVGVDGVEGAESLMVVAGVEGSEGLEGEEGGGKFRIRWFFGLSVTVSWGFPRFWGQCDRFLGFGPLV